MVFGARRSGSASLGNTPEPRCNVRRHKVLFLKSLHPRKRHSTPTPFRFPDLHLVIQAVHLPPLLSLSYMSGRSIVITTRLRPWVKLLNTSDLPPVAGLSTFSSSLL